MNRVQDTDQRWEKMQQIWEIIDRLRGTSGCPWDRKQTPASIQTYLLEEAHEAAAAVRANQVREVAEELGDLLFMIVFLIYLYEAEGLFQLEEVCETVCDKMKRRHPHVFGKLSVSSAEEVVDNWEQIKASEKADSEHVGLGIPTSLPALMRGYRLLSRLAPKDQPEWNDLRAQIANFSSQHQHLLDSLRAGGEPLPGVFGDLLLSLVNLARLQGLQAESCLHESLGRLEADRV